MSIGGPIKAISVGFILRKNISFFYFGFMARLLIELARIQEKTS